MKLTRSDYDQSARYLQNACDLMDRQAPGKMRATYDILHLAIRRLSPGDHFVGDAAAEITVLRQAAERGTNSGCANGDIEGGRGAAGQGVTATRPRKRYVRALANSWGRTPLRQAGNDNDIHS
jgi:hypothetical protein